MKETRYITYPTFLAMNHKCDSMTKAEIRVKYKNLRLLLSDDNVKVQSIAIAKNFETLDIWNKTYFHVYMPIDTLKEVDTNFIVNLLRKNNKKVVTSKSNFDTAEMTHFLIEEKTEFFKNSYNILEPKNAETIAIQKIEVIVIPLLAFDIKGHRVGYGKGFYDRFLSQCDPNAIFIGVSFFNAVSPIDNIDAKDVKLDICVLPAQIIFFKDQETI